MNNSEIFEVKFNFRTVEGWNTIIFPFLHRKYNKMLEAQDFTNACLLNDQIEQITEQIKKHSVELQCGNKSNASVIKQNINADLQKIKEFIIFMDLLL